MEESMSLHVGRWTSLHGFRLDGQGGFGDPSTNDNRDPERRIKFFREVMRAATEIVSSHRPAELKRIDKLAVPLARVIKELASSERIEEIETAVRIWVTMFRAYTELQRIELEAASACFRAFMQFESARADAV